MFSRKRFIALFGAFLLLIMAGAPIQAQDAPDFVEAVIDHTTAYVGEPILYTWRWYLSTTTLDINNDIPVVLPSFDAFGQETLEISAETAIRGSQPYQIITQQIVLYPRREGVLTINPLRVMVPETPFAPAKPLESAQLTLTIKPLPADAPTTFGNAIGQFDLHAALDRQEAKTGDPITLNMTITGSGNGPLIYTPQLTLGNEWRVYVGKSSTRRDGPLLGERVFTWTLIPLQPGTLTITSQAWSFLNPQTGQYETRATTPFTVAIMGDPISEPAIAPAAAEPTLYPLNYGIRLARPGETPQGPIVIDSHGSRSFYPRSGITSDGILLAIMTVVVALAVWLMGFFWKTQTQPKAKTGKQKRISSFQQRMTGLAQKSPDQVAVGIQEILRDTLSQKFGSVTLDTIEDFIPDLPAEVQKDWHACIDLARTARYAPFTPEDARRLIQDAQGTLDRTEALWRAN